MSERAEEGAFEVLISPKHIKSIMDQEGLTYQQVADLADRPIDVSTVWYTASRDREVTLPTLRAITEGLAKALGYEKDELTKLVQ